MTLLGFLCYAGLGSVPAAQQYLSNIPLIPSEDIRDKQKKTMLTAQNLLAEGTKDMEKASNSKECTENFGISLGKGLPPIPRKLADRILRGEFIDMQKLLPESWQVADQELEGPENRARGSRRRVLDIKVWVQCFACYMGVIATGRPQRIPELLVYLVQIVRVNQEFEGSDWAVYDETFHRQAAVSGNQQWSKLNPSLFSLLLVLVKV